MSWCVFINFSQLTSSALMHPMPWLLLLLLLLPMPLTAAFLCHPLHSVLCSHSFHFLLPLLFLAPLLLLGSR